MKGTFPVNKFRELETPFYYYDVNVLRETLSCINKEAGKYNNFCVHYAVKANANHKVLTIIRESGLGADCVSGGEIRAAIKAGFPTNKIVYAGVGCRQRQNSPCSFPYQSECRCAYPCKYHHRTSRKQIRDQHGRYGQSD